MGIKSLLTFLKFESLQEDFTKLMQQYNLSMSLTKERINVGLADDKRLTRANLSREMIQAINDFAREDFRLFGYEMMEPSSKQQ